MNCKLVLGSSVGSSSCITHSSSQVVVVVPHAQRQIFIAETFLAFLPVSLVYRAFAYTAATTDTAATGTTTRLLLPSISLTFNKKSLIFLGKGWEGLGKWQSLQQYITQLSCIALHKTCT